jgi:hypothetical protein
MMSYKEMTSNAEIRVLSTPDLLILILSQLPHSSLLKAKLVNTTWACLFKHVEIQAALFKRPWPKGSALYTETYSDVLRNKFSGFWPIKGEGVAIIKQDMLHFKESNDMPIDTPNILSSSEISLQTTRALQLPLQGHIDNCCSDWQWRQLLVCQPPIEVLELVQHVDRRGGSSLEFRTIIHRSDGLRMGFLYDAVRHWFEVERSLVVKLLWDRRTGDLIDDDDYYEDGSSYKTAEDKPCVTIWGRTNVGCSQYGGLTYNKYTFQHNSGHGKNPIPEIIKSGVEEVEYSMSDPKRIDSEW